MLRIHSIIEEPIHILNYRSPVGDGRVSFETLPLYLAYSEGLPESVDALLLTADLQGVEMDGNDEPARLIGLQLAEELSILSQLGAIPEADRLGVCLCGDLYIDPELQKRGKNGDVRHVWNDFAGRFRWVVGVAGNHDHFGTGPKELAAFSKSPGIHFLDSDIVTLDGISIGGISGIIGNPARPFRHDEETFRMYLRRLLSMEPDLILLHEGPQVDEMNCKGSPVIRSVIDQGPATLIVSGHKNWDFPGFWKSVNGSQVINVEGRAVLMVRESFRGVT